VALMVDGDGGGSGVGRRSNPDRGLGACEEEGEGGRATGANAGQQVDGDPAT